MARGKRTLSARAAGRRLFARLLSNEPGRTFSEGGVHARLCVRGGKFSGGAVVEADFGSHAGGVEVFRVRLGGDWDTKALVAAVWKCQKWRRETVATRTAEAAADRARAAGGARNPRKTKRRGGRP